MPVTLASYFDGHELPLENGLPLCLTGTYFYPESEVSLLSGARITLITDGLVEAQNIGGELFGFERAAAMSTGTAEEIARATQDSGQEDDITVFTLTRQPIPDQATDQLVTQALFPPVA